MINKKVVYGISNKICTRILKKKCTPTGYVCGGEYLVYFKSNSLTFNETNSDEAQLALEGYNVVCMVCYSNTPDLKTECTVEAISNKIFKSLSDMGIEIIE